MNKLRQGENDRGEQRLPRGLDILVGGVLCLVALIVYLVTLSAGAYPGASAGLIVESLDMFPKVLPSHPLWNSLAWFCSCIPWGGIASKLNLLSALCGAGAVWLLYGVVRIAVQKAIEPFSPNWYRSPFACRLAGVSSALFLAFCVPFWMVSTRAHTAAFNALILLVVVRLFIHWLGTRRPWMTFLVMFLCAVVCVEFATALLLLPVLCIVMPVVLRQKDELRAGVVAGLLVSLIAGLSLHLASAWVFYGSEGYILRGYTGYIHILRQIAKLQYTLLAHGLPREGWLIILFITVVPWLTALVVGRRALNVELDWSYYLLHVIMTALVLLVLLNVKIAPWPMLEAQAEMSMSKLMVTPYLISASLFGYLLAYWFLLPASWWERGEHRVILWLRKWLGTILIIPPLAAVVVMPFLNAGPANGKQARFVNDYAEATIESLAGREWLVTDGSIDSHLQIAAWDRDMDLNILSLPASRNELYMRYVASKFEEVRIRNLAQVGMVSMLHGWIASDSAIGEKLAIQASPDIWIGEGYVPVPNMLVFLGVTDIEDLDTARLMTDHEVFWDRLVPAISNARVRSDTSEALRSHMIRHMGFVANNLGVLMEDRGAGEEAFKAYEASREIDPDNISALLNQFAMVNTGMMPDRAEAVRRDVKGLVENLKARYRIWSLSRYYGYVRLPQAFADLGWKWAYSGQPGLAVAGIKRAMGLLPEEGRGRMRSSLANLHLLDGNAAASEDLYAEMLKEDPENLDALFGMSRVSLLQSRPKDSLEYLRKARNRGAKRSRVALELAGVLAASGNTARARVILEELIELEPRSVRAWALLTTVFVQERDEKSLAECVEKMKQAKIGRSGVRVMAEGHLALMRNEPSKARSHFERILAMDPNQVHALEMMLRLDLQQGRSEDAEAHVKRLLSLDSGNALANSIKGSIQYSRGNLLLAEDSLRKALETVRAPESLNDLAWILQEREMYEEAEQLAREALEVKKQFPGAWDTLGVILTKTGRTSEAEEALKKSQSLLGDNPIVHLHLAQLYKKTGNTAELDRMLELLAGDAAGLSREQLRLLEKLRE